MGASCAALLALNEVDQDIHLLDIIEGLPQGEALDLSHAASILGKAVTVKGSNNYEEMSGSDIVVVTAGLARKPGMTREELVSKNVTIVSSIADQIRKFASDSIVIITTNPLDAMVYVLFKKLGFPRKRVIGFSGILDSGRLSYYASAFAGAPPSAIKSVVLGQHGESMFPVPELSMMSGKPLTELMSPEQYQQVVKQTVEAGAEVTKLRGFSSNWGPAAGLLLMCDAIKKDRKQVIPVSVYLDGEYGTRDIFADVPAIIGKSGVERVVELNLDKSQQAKFSQSIQAIRNNLEQVKSFL